MGKFLQERFLLSFSDYSRKWSPEDLLKLASVGGLSTPSAHMLTVS